MKNVVDAILDELLSQIAVGQNHGLIGTSLRGTITKHLLAHEFVKVLKEWLNETEYQTVLRLNEQDIADKGICHSHDYCDAASQ